MSIWKLELPWDGFDELVVWLILALITAMFAHNLERAYKRWKGTAD